MSSGRCWYCRVTMTRPPGGGRCEPTSWTREHLNPRSRSRGRGSRIVGACYRCNHFVGDMPVDQKLYFQQAIQTLGGWPGVLRAFNDEGQFRAAIIKGSFSEVEARRKAGNEFRRLDKAWEGFLEMHG